MNFKLEEVQISKARPENSKDILRLLKSSENLVGYKGETFTLNEIKDYIKRKTNFVVVSKFKSKIIAVLIANLWKEYCYLYLFVVDKEYRGLGIGNKMMNYLEIKVKDEGYIGLMVKERNIEMVNLIKKMGYKSGDKFIYFHKDLK